MTGETNAPAAAGNCARLLADDLACVRGALAEIATTWRRARQTRPDIPVGVPARLQDAAGQLAADIRMLASGDPAPGLAPVASRLRALRDDIVSARAITCGPGMPPAGDAVLWDALSTAMRRAESRLPGLVAS